MLDEPDYSRVLELISTCDDPAKLQKFIENAARKNVQEVRDAAVIRLTSLTPENRPGTLEYDFWRTLKAYERALREQGKPNVRLLKSREKVASQGVEKTLTDWATLKLHKWVFDYLVQNGMSDLTGESVILRHADRFDDITIVAAKARLNLETSIELQSV